MEGWQSPRGEMVSLVFMGSSARAEAAQLRHSLCPQNPLLSLLAMGTEQVKTEANKEQAVMGATPQHHRLWAQPAHTAEIGWNWPLLTFSPAEKPQKHLPHLHQRQRTWP